MGIGGLTIDVRPPAKAGFDDGIFGKHSGHLKNVFLVRGKGGLRHDWI